MAHLPKLALAFFILCFAISCSEPDIKLVNQIKTFGPKWSTMGEKLNFVDRNLNLLEDKVEANYKELEPIFDQIPDSLRGSNLRKLLKGYKDIVDIRDSLRTSYKAHKAEYTISVEAFNVWEKKVMNGDVETTIAYTDLRKFKESYGNLDAAVEQMKAEMSFVATEHNRIFRGLSNSLEVPTNYDIILK